jgi:hypothetical protein
MRAMAKVFSRTREQLRQPACSSTYVGTQGVSVYYWTKSEKYCPLRIVNPI